MSDGVGIDNHLGLLFVQLVLFDHLVLGHSSRYLGERVADEGAGFQGLHVLVALS